VGKKMRQKCDLFFPLFFFGGEEEVSYKKRGLLFCLHMCIGLDPLCNT